MADISTDTIDAIMRDARSRMREYGKKYPRSAFGGNLEWWVLTSAYEAGKNAAKGKPIVAARETSDV